MPSRSYLSKLVERTRAYVPEWLFKALHNEARAHAGGKARHGLLEKAQPDASDVHISKPYQSVDDLPAATKKLSAKKRRQWMHVFNSVHASTGDESRAAAAAWSAVRKDEDDSAVSIVKIDDEKQIAYSVVYEPEAVDQQGDFAKVEEIEKAAHKFLKKISDGTAYVDIGHDDQPADVDVVESFIAPVDFVYDGSGQVVRKGSWVMAMHVKSPEIWKIVKESLGGVSMAGHGKRVQS